MIDGIASRYKNAFSIIAPAIYDTLSMLGRPNSSQFQHLMSWAFSARELCDCLEDGILRLTDGPFNLYVPDFDWDLVEKHIGPSPLYDHLCQKSSSTHSLQSTESVTGILRNLVLQYIDVDPNEFSPDLPFTAYGIDSLIAGRLSSALRPYLTISQLQLLGNTTLVDLERQIEKESAQRQPVQSATPEGDRFDWGELNKSGETVVKLVDYGDTPLILVHGASGSIVAFLPMQEKVTSSLWALQITPETPLHSIEAMAQFYVEKIKIAQPFGPYRIGAYSGTTIIGIMIAKLLEAAGGQIAQFVIIDHSPLLFASPYMEPDEDTIRLRSPTPAMSRQALAKMLLMYRAEELPMRHRFAQMYEDAADGLEVPDYIKEWYTTFTTIVKGTYELMFQLLPPEQPYSTKALLEALVVWMGTLRAPVSAYFASNGVRQGVPEEAREEWKDGGLRRAYPDAQIVEIEGTHFSMIESPRLLEAMQFDWRMVGHASRESAEE